MLLCSFDNYRMKRAQTCYLNNDMKSVNISLKVVNAVKVDFAGPCILSSVQQGASPLITVNTLQFMVSFASLKSC